MRSLCKSLCLSILYQPPIQQGQSERVNDSRITESPRRRINTFCVAFTQVLACNAGKHSLSRL